MKKHLEKLLEIRDVSKRRDLLVRAGLAEEEIEELLERVHFLRKGKEKFPRAAKMRFSREGLAQASSKWVAEYRTLRIRERLGGVARILDVCAGIGGDTIALATRWPVIAIERDPETMAILRHNLGVHGLEEKVQLIEGDILQLLDDESARAAWGQVDCIFFDPSRRAQGSRRIETELYAPPLSLLDRLRGLTPNVVAKISPAVDLSSIEYDCDIEVISYKGSVKEITLWFGALQSAAGERRVRATKLPEKITWTKKAESRKIGTRPPGAFLYEPDPAFIKAHLIQDLARHFQLELLDSRLAFLTSDVRIDDPTLKRYRVCESVEVSDREIERRLQAHGIGRADFKARGIAVNLQTLQKRIRPQGRDRGLVILTRVEGRKRALLCRYDSRY
jgi:hypothetical protein